MDGSVMGPAMLSGSGGGVLELEPSLHLPLSMHHHQQALTHHLQGLAPLSTTQHVSVSQECEQSLGLEPKGTPKMSLICSKERSVGTSDEDEPSFTEDGGDGLPGGGKNKNSTLWHRMKWTDSMVRLLINIVLLVGEDGTVDSNDGNNKRKCGVLQKKGKWKSVSRLMMERGCYVSPQQCEDKFNDLNKRYKRLNDILGKGTACCIVENPSLMDAMDNIPPKTKEDVRKILSSKHLFYKEMCSYHSGCKSLALADLDFQPSPIQAGIMGKIRDPMPMKEQHDMDDDDAEDGEEEEEEGGYGDDDDYDDDNEVDTEPDALRGLPSPFGKCRKSFKYSEVGNFGSLSDHIKTVSREPANSDFMAIIPMQDGSKLTSEQWWIRTRALQLEEQKVSLHAQAIELEKQRFKWQRLSSKKDRETDKLRLENERIKLENERMSLRLKQKELEVEFKRSEASMASIALILERLKSKD
eukprot:c26659_g1_i1 orf=383-1789(+)